MIVSNFNIDDKITGICSDSAEVMKSTVKKTWKVEMPMYMSYFQFINQRVPFRFR